VKERHGSLTSTVRKTGRDIPIIVKASSYVGRKVRLSHATEHRINLNPGSKPVHAQPYRAGPRARELERQDVSRILKAGFIEPESTEWASPVVLVPKPDGTMRFCVDYLKLNAMTIRDTYPRPRMDECIDSLENVRIFITLD
jgi:hypothetical protein